MKELEPTPPAVVRNQHASVRALFEHNVLSTYARFDIVFSHGSGSLLWDVNGRRYIDLGGGIAVCSLGHAHPEIGDTLAEQGRKLLHISNLYYHEPQGRLAFELNRRVAPGRVFFSNSGAEANEGLYKLARKFGHDEGRFEIITALNSFHGRTLAGISATGQEKVKKGFEPMVQGFRHVPFNDLAAMEAAISPATAAILIEGIQGEGGITPATAAYLAGLRQLCDRKNLLLLMDGVQCGHFRSGRFQSFQRILEGHPAADTFLPDGFSMAKSLGGGFPMGAFWVREDRASLLGPGTHATTYGGTPLGCAVALKVLEVIERDQLDKNARDLGDYILQSLQRLVATYPSVLKSARGVGLMIGLELADRAEIPGFKASERPASLQLIDRLHESGLLCVPSGTQVIRFLPALNLTRPIADEALQILERHIREIS